MSQLLDAVVVGGGQAGLAASHRLAERGLDHVVLERGDVGERWRSQRWDSLRLLTPNWLTDLPGLHAPDAASDGFRTRAEVVRLLEGYASEAPVRPGAGVARVRLVGDRYEITSTAGWWTARNVVLATGWCDRPAVPAAAAELAADVFQIDSTAYRSPRSLPPGGVLVVGASSTGVQLAEELRLDGRDVVLAVGRHARLPRRYRGMDVFWWLERIGALDRRVEDRPAAVQAEPSLQLIGRDGPPVDLPALAHRGVELVGRFVGASGHRVAFADDLPATTADAARRASRVLGDIDAHARATGLDHEVLAASPLEPLRLPVEPTTELDLRRRGITSVLWATGYRRSYPWLEVPVLDGAGEIRHRHGVTPAPGLYVLGQRFQTRRRSAFLGGVGRDATEVVDHLAARLASPSHPPCAACAHRAP
jgi:putative flavoprotein involved in K+ transport